MKKILENKFKFKYIPKLGIEAWSKRYNGFVLYIVKKKKMIYIWQVSKYMKQKFLFLDLLMKNG